MRPNFLAARQLPTSSRATLSIPHPTDIDELPVSIRSSSSSSKSSSSSTSSSSASESSSSSSSASPITSAVPEPITSDVFVPTTTSSSSRSVIRATATVTQSEAASTTSSTPPKPFLQNKVLSGMVFGLVAIVAIAMLVSAGTMAFRRYRRRRELQEAISFDPDNLGKPAANDTPHFLEKAPNHDSYAASQDNLVRGHSAYYTDAYPHPYAHQLQPQYTGNSHGPYGYQA